MKQKNITKYDLLTSHNISESVMYRLRHNKSVTTNTIAELCCILQCDITDIVYFY